MKTSYENPTHATDVEKVLAVANIGGLNIEFGKYSNFNYPYHTHVFNELVIVLSGTGLHVVNDEIYTLMAGDVFVLKNEDCHELKNTKNLEFCNIIYLPSNLEVIGSDIKMLPGFHDLFVFKPFYRNKKRALSTFRLNATQLLYVKELSINMRKEYESGNKASETMLTAYFMQLVVYLCREYEESVSEQSQPDFDIAYALSYLESNYSEDLTVTQLASIANMSSSHFTKTFNEVFNLSPMQYLKQLRIKKACVLLTNTNISITEIAAMVGIDDSNYFARAFKSVIGISPREYRYTKNISIVQKTVHSN